MSVRIAENSSDGTIAGDKLSDGQLAVIVSGINGCYVGRIVQQHAGIVIQIGQLSGHTFRNGLSKTTRLRVLPNGTMLEVTDNE